MRVRIEDENATYEFDGEVIAGPVSTRLDPKERQRARWLEGTLYRRADSTYVYDQLNLSTVWHLTSGTGHVRAPTEIASADLPELAVYCGVLPARPGREHCPLITHSEARRMTIPALVVAELPQRRIMRFPDHSAVIQRLLIADQRAGGSSVAISRPMRELLRQAARNDPAFRIKPVISL